MLYLVPTRYSVLLTLYEFVLHNSCLVYATKVQINVRSTFGEYSLGINRDNARHTTDEFERSIEKEFKQGYHACRALFLTLCIFPRVLTILSALQVVYRAPAKIFL